MSPNPVDHPTLYDVIVLAGQQSPGVCRLSFPTRDQGWETQQPKGSTGGETIHNGERLVEFDVEFTLWKEDGVDHFARWDEWKLLFRKPIATKDSKALDVYHPQLDELKIKSVVVKTFSPPQPVGDGSSIAKVKFLEYAPPKPKAAGKPNGSTTGKGGGYSSAEHTAGGGSGGAGSKPPDPNQARKDEVAELTEEYNSP